MVTIPRAVTRVQWTSCTTPWCPQLGGHPSIGRHMSTPPQPGASASGRPPANAREIDGDHPQGSHTSAMDLLHHAMVSQNWVAIQLLGDTCPPRRNRVRPRVGDHPRMPERSMVTIPRASTRVQRTSCTTPWCTQLGGHQTIGRHKSTPPQPGSSASGRPPANAKEIDDDHPQGIRPSAMDLLHHAMVSPIGRPSNYWAIHVHPAAMGCVRECATTRECQRDRW